MALWIISAQESVTAYGNDLGPKLLPAVAAGLIILLATAGFLLGLVRSLAGGKAATGEEDVAIARPQIWAIMSVTIAMALFVLCLFPLGYPLAAFLLLACLMVWIGARDYLRVALISASVATALYIGMTYGFGTRLPLFPSFAFGT